MGPDLAAITNDLEALKLSLVAMKAEDLPVASSAALAEQISAIRLQLKRLEFDREAVQATLDSLHDL